MHARSPKQAKQLTTLPVFAPTDDPPMRPEWLRIDDAVRIFGISRSKLYQLINERKIRSFSLRERNKLKGIRLINYDSISEFMEGEAVAQATQDDGN
jgi:predicted DNA-binding transcriptional regulator AlpA